MENKLNISDDTVNHQLRIRLYINGQKVIQKTKKYARCGREEAMKYMEDVREELKKQYFPVLEKIKEERHEKRREQQRVYSKKWGEENKEKRAAQNKKWREENKEKIKERNSKKFTCEICGETCSHQNRSRHNKSITHQIFLGNFDMSNCLVIKS